MLQPCLQQLCFIKKKMGRPACLNANIWGRWKTHIRDPSTPVDTLALSHWKSRAMPMMATEIFERSFFGQGRMNRFQPGKTMTLQKKRRLYIQWMGWWGSLYSLGRDRPSDSRMHIHGSTWVRFSFQFSKYSANLNRFQPCPHTVA